MFLIQKYTQYKAAQAEQQKRKVNASVTEKELAQLNHKIDKLLSKLDEHEPEIADNQDDECVVCVNAKATMQTYPCGHRVVCRKCFVKTIQMAVAQRLLPLRCVLCRAKIFRLKHASGNPLTSSASQYTIGSQWYHVPQSTSLYSVTSSMSGVSGVSGVSSASSCSSASSYKTCASSFSSTSLKKRSYTKQGYQPLRTSSPSPSRSPQNKNKISENPPQPSRKDYQRVSLVEPPLPKSKSIPMTEGKSNNVNNNNNNGATTPTGSAPAPPPPTKGKLSLIQEFQREFRNGKSKTVNERKGSSGSHRSSSGSTRIKCARLLVNQAQPSYCSSSSASKSGIPPTEKVAIIAETSGVSGTGIRSGKSCMAVSGGTVAAAVGCGKNTNNIGFRRATPPPLSQSCHSFRLSRHDSVAPSSYSNFKKGSLQTIDDSDSVDAKPTDRAMPLSTATAKLSLARSELESIPCNF